MMKQDQVLDAYFLGDFHSFQPRGMSPALARSGQLLGGKLRIINENIRACRQLPQTLVELRIARFVVRGINDRSSGGLKAKAQATLRVVQPTCFYARPRHFKLISPADFRKIAAR